MEKIDTRVLVTITEKALRKSRGMEPLSCFADTDDRSVRRKIMRAHDEIERDWKAGKSIQRKQQLQYMNSVWEASGMSIVGFDKHFECPPDIVSRQWKHQEAAIDIAAAGMTTMLPQAQQHMPESWESMSLLVAGVQPLLYASFVFSRANRLSRPNVFNVSDALVENLLLTDVAGLKPSDVQLPFPGFYISFSPGILSIKNESTGHHDVTLVGVSEGSVPEYLASREHMSGRSLFGVFWGEPRRDSATTGDDNVTHMSMSLSDRLESLAESVDERLIPIHRDVASNDAVRFLGRSYGYEDGCRMLRQFMANFCLFLSSPSPDIEPSSGGQGTWGGAVEAAESKRTLVKIRLDHRAGQYASWDVGRKSKRLSCAALPHDIIVRGHWRRQAHGKGRLLRRVIWIEPHIRNASDNGVVPGHDYEHDR
jgi:hypothetical protein